MNGSFSSKISNFMPSSTDKFSGRVGRMQPVTVHSVLLMELPMKRVWLQRHNAGP